ncbi:hypothetical protein CHELA20_40343 [Hyphomicrobiales bacterium]|nr:hypothetical protein CHELA20_40343 [Hyphomicrobiales bacterium]CAH1688269.1 hypothetical protein CHELA41_40200 [Hyphomicrobiales bacterium]
MPERSSGTVPASKSVTHRKKQLYFRKIGFISKENPPPYEKRKLFLETCGGLSWKIARRSLDLSQSVHPDQGNKIWLAEIPKKLPEIKYVFLLIRDFPTIELFVGNVVRGISPRVDV